MDKNTVTTLSIPIDKRILENLKAGQKVLISGTLYTVRDAVHKRLHDLHYNKKSLPIPLKGAVIYYAGPAPTKPGYIIGPISPTTAARCDAYTPLMLALGVKAMIGKGNRSDTVIKAIRKHRAVYFAATGGAAAFYARCITSAQVVAFKDLGTEAVIKMTVKQFPAFVAIDSHGNSLYEQGPKTYRKTIKKEE